MAGSLKWYRYTADNAANYAIFRDESNSEAVSGASACLPAFVAGDALLPGRLRTRYVNTVLSTDQSRKKRFPIGTLAIFNAITSGSTIVEAGTPTLTWNVLSKRGEAAPIPYVGDTGITDGDG